MMRAEPIIEKETNRIFQKCFRMRERGILPSKGFSYFGSGDGTPLVRLDQNVSSAFSGEPAGSTEAGCSKKEEANSPWVGSYPDR